MRKTLLLRFAILAVACPKKHETTSTATTALTTSATTSCAAAPTSTAALTHSGDDLVAL